MMPNERALSGRPPLMAPDNRNEFPSSELSYKTTGAAADKFKHQRHPTPDSVANYENRVPAPVQEQNPQRVVDAKPKSYDYLFV